MPQPHRSPWSGLESPCPRAGRAHNAYCRGTSRAFFFSRRQAYINNSRSFLNVKNLNYYLFLGVTLGSLGRGQKDIFPHRVNLADELLLSEKKAGRWREGCHLRYHSCGAAECLGQGILFLGNLLATTYSALPCICRACHVHSLKSTWRKGRQATSPYR